MCWGVAAGSRQLRLLERLTNDVDQRHKAGSCYSHSDSRLGWASIKAERAKSGDAALSVQGVVAEAVPSVLKRLTETVEQSHKAGLFFFTYGDANNAVEHYSAQRAAGVDAIILDDTARLAKVCIDGKVPPSPSDPVCSEQATQHRGA